MGGNSIQNATTIKAENFTGYISDSVRDTLVCTKVSKVTITGTDLKIENIKEIKFTLDTEPIYIKIVDIDAWEKVSVEANKIVLKAKVGNYYKTSRTIQENLS